MRLFKATVALAFVAALFLMPLAQAMESTACGLFGVSAAQAKSCHGCCAKMKCCAEPASSDKSPPLQGSSSRAESHFAAVVAILPRLVVALHSFPPSGEAPRPAPGSLPAPAFSSLDRLCIRLI